MASDDAAVVVTLRANLKDYEAALKSAVRATERAAKAAEAAVAGVGSKAKFTGLNQNAQQASRSMQSMQADAKNLGFQFNDLATSIASGGGALRAFAQQGGQIAQIFSGQSLKSIGATIGTALLDPFVLIPIAIGVATAAMTGFFNDADNDAVAHRKLLDQIQQKWGDLIPGIKEYIASIDDATEAVERHAAKVALVDEAWTNVKPIIGEVSNDVRKLQQQLRLADQADDATKLGKAMADWKKELDEGRPGFEQLKELLDLISKVSKDGSSSAAALAATIEQKLSPALEGVKNKLQDIDKLFGGFQFPGAGGPLDLGPITGQNRVDLLNKSLEKAAGAIDSFVEDIVQAESSGRANAKNPNSTATGAGQFLERTWLDVIHKYFPEQEAGRSSAEILALRNDAELSRQAIRRYAEENARALQDSGEIISEANLHLAHFLGAGGALKVLKAAPGTRIADIPGMQDAVAANPKILGGGATREDVLAYAQRRTKSTAAAEQKKNYDELVVSINEKIAAQERENAINADSTATTDEKTEALQREKAAQEAARVEKQLNDAVVEQGLALTDDVKAKNHELAESYAAAGLKADQLSTAQKKAAEAAADQKQAAQQLAQQIGQMAQTAFSGLINDLRNGVDAGDAFNNMLNRILDSLIQMSLQSLFNPAGGGGIGGWLASLFPGAYAGGQVSHLAGKQRKVSPLAFANAPRFAAGGVVGLRPGEVPIIAHRGEIVVPNARRLASSSGGGRVDNSIHQQNRISIDMAGSGYVAANSQNAKTVGENIQKLIQAELVRESRPGGLLRQVPR